MRHSGMPVPVRHVPDFMHNTLRVILFKNMNLAHATADTFSHSGRVRRCICG